MLKRSTRLRLRRKVRSTGQSVKEAQSQAADHLDKHVVRRWQKFNDVKRFMFGWLVLIGLLLFGIYLQSANLHQFYKETVRAEGGIYTEGVVGEVKNANPLFAASPADRTVSRLLFEPLLKYDHNAELTGALARDWRVDKTRSVYSINLREGLKWSDGRDVTSEDVVFTFNAIQHQDTGSPLERSWRDIEVTAEGERVVKFTLPNAFTPFLHSLTNVGILPEHVLGSVPLSELRADPFNLQPKVSSGPFSFVSMISEDAAAEVRLRRYADYYGGAARLNEFIVQSFIDHEELIKAFNEGAVMGASGLRSQDLEQIDSPQDRYTIQSPPLFNNVLLFFNNSDAPFNDKDVRLGLTRATDNKAIFEMLNRQYPISDAPILNGQLGYTKRYAQQSFNQKEAAKLLDKAGWKLGDDGLRHKGDRTLELTMIAQNSDEYPQVAEAIQRQWLEVGVKLKLEMVNPDKLQPDYIAPHAYTLLLLGIDLGVDPDVFVYWHSSEARIGGFNLSEYKNDLVDAALEAGRTRTDTSLRRAKYQSFLRQWRADAPGVALYRPTFFYAQLSVVEGFDKTYLADPIDRLSDVNAWTILTEEVPRQL